MSHLPLINRNAIIITYKKPFIDWIKQADIENSADLDNYQQDECPIYLLSEFGNDNEMWEILEKRYKDIFFND